MEEMICQNPSRVKPTWNGQRGRRRAECKDKSETGTGTQPWRGNMPGQHAREVSNQDGQAAPMAVGAACGGLAAVAADAPKGNRYVFGAILNSALPAMH